MTVGPLCTGSRHVIRIVVLGVACLVGLGAIAAATKKSGPPPAAGVVMPIVAGNKADRLPFTIKLDMPAAGERADVTYVQPGEEEQADFTAIRTKASRSSTASRLYASSLARSP